MYQGIKKIGLTGSKSLKEINFFYFDEFYEFCLQKNPKHEVLHHFNTQAPILSSNNFVNLMQNSQDCRQASEG